MNAAKLTTAMVAFALSIMVQPISAQGPRVTHFKLTPRLLKCLARFPGDADHPPTAHVTVTRGNLNDFLFLRLSNIKPGLAFDLFTVQRSNLLANGTPDPNFKNFGLAWYQSDIQVDSAGNA